MNFGSDLGRILGQISIVFQVAMGCCHYGLAENAESMYMFLILSMQVPRYVDFCPHELFSADAHAYYIHAKYIAPDIYIYICFIIRDKVTYEGFRVLDYL